MLGKTPDSTKEKTNKSSSSVATAFQVLIALGMIADALRAILELAGVLL